MRLEYGFATGHKAYAGSVVDPNPLDITNISWTRHDLTLSFEHAFGDHVRLGGTLPFSMIRVHNNAWMSDVKTNGFQLGDIGAYAVFQPWESTDPLGHHFFDPHNLQLLFGMTFPTGDERAGSLPGLHFLQLGSGSIDPRFGVGYSGRLGRFFGLYGDVGLRLDGGADSSGYRSGNIYTARVGAMFTPIKYVSIAVSNELVVRNINYQSGGVAAESGGVWDFFVPRVLIAPFGGFFIDASAGIPVWRHVFLQQPVAAFNASVAVGYYF
ncbi:MAG TPA: hypothetical protein VG389_26500 [Myxococcota bacterium]|nr:hypothetical protein [Myxococcota bacterium]